MLWIGSCLGKLLGKWLLLWSDALRAVSCHGLLKASSVAYAHSLAQKSKAMGTLDHYTGNLPLLSSDMLQGLPAYHSFISSVKAAPRIKAGLWQLFCCCKQHVCTTHQLLKV